MNNKWTQFIANLSWSLTLPLIRVAESKLAHAQLTFPAQESSQEIAEFTSITILLPLTYPCLGKRSFNFSIHHV